MSQSPHTFNERIAFFNDSERSQTLAGIRRGVEREALRIAPDGRLSQTPHPKALGSALTHDSITTDFSESLLEFITPPHEKASDMLEELADIHKFSLSEMNGEMLWPMSMPCFIEDEDSIPLAYYGESNVAKMKRIYRMGLKNRYGSMMQAIAGVHYNFSLPDSFWQAWAEMKGEGCNDEFISAEYFSLIRNYRRLCWLIPYLYGASPALCSSFLEGKAHNLPFEKVGKGTVYLPWATSLRMSDLGYTNAEQSALQICYNKLENYVALLRKAMKTPSERFARYAAGEEGHYQQLSKNILQIENELYSPIRPKQPTASMEKPTDALVRRGVNYIEVRALDVNPFAAEGISQQQCDFLDVFLLSCLLMPSPDLDGEQLAEAGANMTTMVTEGRKPGVRLQRNSETIAMTTWADELFEQFTQAAKMLDSVWNSSRYSTAVDAEWEKITKPELTLSGRILSMLISENMDNGALGLKLAREYSALYRDATYKRQHADDFVTLAETSLEAQKAVEESDTQDFDTFIRAYFSEPPAKKNA